MHTSSDNSSGTSTPKKTADATKEIYKQNETAAYNGIEITMDSYVESEGDDWSVPTEGNEFMFVHMTIVNQTSDDLVISSMASFENYCDDTKLDYSAAAFTALATTSDQPKLDGTIAPGETLEGYLSLEVPLNWSTIEIRYTDKICLMMPFIFKSSARSKLLPADTWMTKASFFGILCQIKRMQL